MYYLVYQSLLALLGCLVAAYAIRVERNAKKDIKAVCDINDRMSCSKVLTSKYARMLGLAFGLKENHPLNLPNTYFGFLFYLAVFVYPFVDVPYKEFLLMGASGMSMVACVVLAVAMWKLGDFCAVCVTTYFINAGILYCAYQ